MCQFVDEMIIIDYIVHVTGIKAFGLFIVETLPTDASKYKFHQRRKGH